MRSPDGEPRDLGLQRRVAALERAGLLDAGRDAGVDLQEADLHGDDPAEHQADQPDPRAPAQEAVDDAVLGQRAQALEGAGRAAAGRRRQRDGRQGARDRPGHAAVVARRGGVAGAAVMRSARGGGRHQCSSLSLLGGPQSRGLRTGVGRHLAGAGRDGAAEDQLGLRRPAAAADGQVRRADAAARAVGEEALHAPVLERVERDRGEAPARLEDLPGERQRGVELGELLVDGDPDPLERALGGMPAGEARRRGDRRGDRLDQLEGGSPAGRRRTISPAIRSA